MVLSESADINRDGRKRIKPQALESSLRHLLSTLEVSDKIDIDDAVELLSAMWRGIVAAWTRTDKAWDDENSKLADKAGMVSVTEFLVERLNVERENGLDVSDPAKVQKFCQKIMDNVLPDFWLMPWNEKQLDTSYGRNVIRQSLAELRTAVSSNRPDPLARVPLLRIGDTE